jgi:hypothetical protein
MTMIPYDGVEQIESSDIQYRTEDLLAAKCFEQYPRPVLQALLTPGKMMTKFEAFVAVHTYLGLPLPVKAVKEIPKTPEFIPAQQTATFKGGN